MSDYLIGVLLSLLTTLPLAWKWQLGVRRVACIVVALALLASGIVALAPVRAIAGGGRVGGLVWLVTISAAFSLLAYRFYRDPERIPPGDESAIVSPADGTVVYVRRSSDGMLPVSTKRSHDQPLVELTKTPLRDKEAVVIGIAMSFTDVHVNRAPIAGRVTLRRHFPGRFGSLRQPEMVFENERATTIIERESLQVAVVQIASRLVRKIAVFISPGDSVALGQRIGVIRLGSQVDLVLPARPELKLTVREGERVRAGESVVAIFKPSRSTVDPGSAGVTKSTAIPLHAPTGVNGYRSPDYDVAIVGAGPYGLSAGVHLKAKGLGVRVFGEPMDFWAKTMPEGMLLRSHRTATSISDPSSAFTLEAYEAQAGLKPVSPVPLKRFIEYGRWFRAQLGHNLSTNTVSGVRREGSIFRLTLEDGDSVTSRRVIVAAGIGPFQRKPEPFAQLPSGLVSHCYDGREIADLTGNRVAVIGAGQSALEAAALLHEFGAEPEVIAKTAELRWVGRHGWLHHLGPLSQLLYSRHDVGHAGLSRLVGAPMLVSRIPLAVRDRIRARAIRPAGAGWLRPRLKAVKISMGRTVRTVRCVGDEIELTLDDGSVRRVHHVLLGTGYQVDISRYRFLSSEVLAEVRRLDGYPQLTTGFRSTVPGLHFIGATASRTFGPLLCFVSGTEFASRHLTSSICQDSTHVRLK